MNNEKELVDFNEVRKYFDAIVENIELKISHVLDKVTIITDNLHNDVKVHKQSIDTMYERGRELTMLINKVDKRVIKLEEHGKNNKHTITIGIAIISVIVASVAVIVAIFK